MTTESRPRSAADACKRACAAALALAVIVPASAEAAADLRVAPQGGSEQTLSLPQLQANPDVRERVYMLPDGTQVHVTGVSLDELLRRAGIDPYGYVGLTVTAGSSTINFDRDELLGVDAFPEGPPVVFVDDRGTHFLRPAGAAGSGAAQLLTLADGTLRIALSRKGSLHVRARASRTRIEPGQRVTFTATVAGAAAGEQVRVGWTFDRDGRAKGQRVTHRFARTGTYQVVVGATSEVNPTGASAVVTVQVGEQRDGPDRTGGGTNPDASAPDGGSAKGTTAAATGTTNPPSPTPVEPPSRTPHPRRASPERQPAAQRKQPARTSERGAVEHVEGTLLGDAAPPPRAAMADALRAARTGKPAEDTQRAGTLPPLLWGGLTAFALLGLGAWRERRGLPRTRPT